MSYGRSQSPPGEQETFKDSLKLTSSNKIKMTHPKYLVLLSLTGNYVNMNAWLKSYNLVAVPTSINSGVALSKNKL